MASIIFLGSLKPHQEKSSEWDYYNNDGFDNTWCAIIAKGNIIEGIEAKE